MEPRSFRVTQDGIDYSVMVKLLGERVKVEVCDSRNMGVYNSTFTLDELSELCPYFDTVPRSNEAQTELIHCIEDQQIRIDNDDRMMSMTFYLPNGDLVLDLPRESLKMPVEPQNLGATSYVPTQSVVYDPMTGTNRIQQSIAVVVDPSMKKSLYEEVAERPGFGTPFVDQYGDRGFFDTGMAGLASSLAMRNSQMNAMGGYAPGVANSAYAASVPYSTPGIGGSTPYASGLGGSAYAGPLGASAGPLGASAGPLGASVGALGASAGIPGAGIPIGASTGIAPGY